MVAVIVLLGSRTNSHAQLENSEPFSSSSLLTPLPDVLSEGTLQPKARLWFSDRDGVLVLAGDEFAEDYFRARRKSLGGVVLPAAAVERVDVEVDIVDDIANITGRFSVMLTEETATSVDLAFGGVQIDRQDFSGDSQNLVQPTREAAGWRWLLLGQPNTSHVATLSGVSRIARELDRRSLRIPLPSAVCVVKVKLPKNAVDIRGRSEDVVREVRTQDAVELEINSSGGPLSITWRDQQSVSQVAAVNATSTTEFTITDPNQPWLAITKLSVRWYGQDGADQFRIELPPGGQWRTLPNPELGRYQITIVESEAAPAQLVVENYDIALSETIELELEWDWSPEELAGDTMVTEAKLPTPLVGGVDWHKGTIDCIVPSAYSVVFQEGDGAHLIYQGLLVGNGIFARQQLRFEFDRHPFDMSLTFRREQSLPTVRPTYMVDVDPNKLTLTMWFDCSFDTNQPQMELGLILDEWVVQENTARVVSDPSDLFSSSGDVLRIQQQVDRNYIIRSELGESANFGGSRHVDQMWRVVAERSWTAADKGLFFQVPQIIRGLVNGSPKTDHGSGALLVTSESNVLLSWRETAGTGLQRDSFSTEYERFVPRKSMRKPLAYRFQSSETTPLWAGKAELLPRQVSIEQHADLEVVASQIAVRQDFEIQVANEALSELRFAVREDAGEFQPPQVLVNGTLFSSPRVSTIDERVLGGLLNADEASETTSGAKSSDITKSSSSNRWRIYEVLGSPEILGATRVSVLTGLPWKLEENAATTTAASIADSTETEPATTMLNVPIAQLLLPSESIRLRQDWSLRTDLQIETVINADDSGSADVSTGVPRLRPLGPLQREVQVGLRPRRLMGSGPVRIGKSWLQTFVSGNQRRERYVARVATSATEVQLRLPKDANIREGKVKIAIDGYSQNYDYNQPFDYLRVPLSGTSLNEHVIEVSYFLPDSLSWVSKLSISPPQVLGAEQVGQFYWQLLTPSVQHLGWSPSALTADWTWQWTGMWWERKSFWGQRQLEDWSGTEFQELPPASANSYLMMGPRLESNILNDDQSVWVLSRFVLWIPVGLLAIGLSFTVLNFPQVRRSGFVFALAAVLMGLATLWPDMAAMAGQTAVISLGLVALVWAVQAGVESRVRRRSVFSTRPSTYIERSEQFSVPRSVRLGQTTTAHHGSSVGVNGD